MYVFLNCERWLLGPEFLWKSECQWRKEFDTSLVIQNDDPEVKPDPVVKSRATSLVASVVLPSSALADRFQKFSSWHRLKKSIAWILRYRNNLLMAAKDRKVTDQPKSPGRKQSLITLEDMKNAEKAILKTVQQAAYPMEFSELGKLRSGKGVKRSSPLFRLDPILKDGLLCVGGRLARACIPPDAKYQIILPKSSHISDLIVDHYHKLSGHSGRQHVESILNSCPLTVFSDDPRDPEPLTPNHLLLLKSDSPMPPGVFQRDDLFSRRRWRQIQYLTDTFWKRWVSEYLPLYLPLLQSRQKWLHPRRNLTVGDVVLVAAGNTNRNYWPLGRIQQVFPDKKGFVRKVRVKVKSAVLERPVDKLVLLVEKEGSKHAEPENFSQAFVIVIVIARIGHSPWGFSGPIL